VHARRIAALDEDRLPAVAAHQALEFGVRQPPEHGGSRDLGVVQVQDRQHRPIALGIQEFVGVPAGGERARLGLAIADDARDDEIGVVESSAGRMHERVTQLTAFVDRAGGFRRHVARDPARERELLEQPLHAFGIGRDLGIDLAVGAFEIGVRDDAGAAVTRTDDIDHVRVAFLDDAVQVHVDEIEARRRSPVTQQPWLDVRALQGLAQERILQEVDLSDGKVVRGAPVGIHPLQERCRQSGAATLGGAAVATRTGACAAP
jgi:hypothetical protein